MRTLKTICNYQTFKFHRKNDKNIIFAFFVAPLTDTQNIDCLYYYASLDSLDSMKGVGILCCGRDPDTTLLKCVKGRIRILCLCNILKNFHQCTKRCYGPARRERRTEQFSVRKEFFTSDMILYVQKVLTNLIK